MMNEENVYLRFPHKGLALIAKLLARDKDKRKLNTVCKLDDLLDYSFLHSAKDLRVDGEREVSNELQRMSNQLYEHQKINLLHDKTIIGLGGQFSAGKSAFVNSLLCADILPEALSATTSIPTYLVQGPSYCANAYTIYNKKIQIEKDAVAAMTHEFYRKYGLGLSKFVDILSIEYPTFRYENIALLDTPGYSKADKDSKKSVTDRQIALNQLRSADFLIWVIDANDGDIQETDIAFLQELPLANPFLVVLNKADKLTEEECRNVIDKVSETIEREGLDVDGVIAYCSLEEGKEYFSEKKLEAFLEKANNYNNKAQDVMNRFNRLADGVEKQYSERKKDMEKEAAKALELICEANNYNAIKSLVEIYRENRENLNILYQSQKDFKEIREKIDAGFQKVFDL